ncbi:MAG: hypothetical protein JNK50_11875 [Bacteroidia bacterium]|nr:hypothetical protein [Bacteroidia bacterium]
MNSPVKIKTSNTNRVHKMIIAFLLVSTLISLALIITPRFNHIKVFLADFALHHIFMTLFIGFSLLVLFVKFLHEYYKTHSFSWAGIKTYEYYNPATVRNRWYQRLQRMKRKIAHRQLEKINETVLTDVLTNEDDKSKRYRDLLNAMSLGNNFKHKVKLHVKQNNRNSVLEATVWYANEKHVTLKGGKVIPVKTIVKVEY